VASATDNPKTVSVPGGRDEALQERIDRATHALLDRQQRDGHWVFELEPDATIPAEYVLLRHYLDERVDTALEAKIAAYLRRIRSVHGSCSSARSTGCCARSSRCFP